MPDVLVVNTAMLLSAMLLRDAPETLVPTPVIATEVVVIALPGQQTTPQTVPPAPAGGGAIQQPDIVVTGRGAWEAPDPLSKVNEQAFKATEAVDKAVVGPVARAYKQKVPSPIRRGIHNFLYNLREPVVFVNFVLQHKIGKALETVGRFAINSTVGVIGVFDMAKRKPFKLPRRSNGFANTLGFYGVPNGPFMFLPLVGPTTVRDLFGGAIDRIVLPVTLGQGVTDPKFAIPAGVLGALDHRAEFDETLVQLHDRGGDPYVNSRDFYLQRRQAEIDRLKGRSTGSVGGMTEAPTAPIRVRPRSDAVDPPAPVEPVPVEPAVSPPAAAPVDPGLVPVDR
ncbi:hypothetical protein ASG07_15020 [Sphingomonas sp. Leaf343]|nr:hypothetical protein ASG07_15020 [Sphingomonas sp. Leaf343]